MFNIMSANSAGGSSDRKWKETEGKQYLVAMAVSLHRTWYVGWISYIKHWMAVAAYRMSHDECHWGGTYNVYRMNQLLFLTFSHVSVADWSTEGKNADETQ